MVLAVAAASAVPPATEPARDGAAAGAVVEAAATKPFVVGTTPSGPDVARWQHPNGACIDWRRVAAGDATTRPRQFAFVKATEGTTYVNPYFRSCAGSAARGDWRASGAAGLARAAYHYARPTLPLTSAADQARFFARVIGDQRKRGILPPVLDLEDTGGLSPAQLVTWTQIFLDTLRKETGRVPIVYTYPYFWSSAMAGSDAFHDYPLWIADYRDPQIGPRAPLPGGWPDFTFWQYTSSATQPGVRGRIDMNWFNGGRARLAALADGTAPLQWTVEAPAAPAVSVSTGSRTATVRWVPRDNGGALVTSYVVTASDGRTKTVNRATSSVSFGGLTNGQGYSFTVRAVNAAGAGEPAATGVVVPRVPTALSAAVTPTRVVYGDPAELRVLLRRSDSNQRLPGRLLTVWQRPAGTSEWTPAATVQTDALGVARWTFVPEAATEVRVTFAPASGAYQSQESPVLAVAVRDVPTAIEAAASPSTAAPGQAVTVSGRLLRSDTGAPVGDTVLEVYTRPAGTVTLAPAGTVAVGADGRFTWTFVPTGSTDVRLRWRAPEHWATPRTTLTVLVADPPAAAGR